MKKNKQLINGFALGIMTCSTAHITQKQEGSFVYVFLTAFGIMLIPVIYDWYINFTYKEKSNGVMWLLAVVVLLTCVIEGYYSYFHLNDNSDSIIIASIVLNMFALAAGDSIKIETNENLKSKDRVYE